jgi:hypothetical protein
VEANSTGGQGSRRAVAPNDDDDDDDDDDIQNCIHYRFVKDSVESNIVLLCVTADVFNFIISSFFDTSISVSFCRFCCRQRTLKLLKYFVFVQIHDKK